MSVTRTCARCGERRPHYGRGMCQPCYQADWQARQRQRRPCRHCGTPRKYLRRGLCNPCYDTPDVRALYPRNPSGVPAGYHYAPDFYRPAPLPPQPTAALPGTPEKGRVMRERAAGGYQLFHPEDALHDGATA